MLTGYLYAILNSFYEIVVYYLCYKNKKSLKLDDKQRASIFVNKYNIKVIIESKDKLYNTWNCKCKSMARWLQRAKAN